MDADSEQKPTRAEIAQGLGKTLAVLFGISAALLILPTLPYALLAGMETDPSARSLMGWTPILFAISAGAALFCIKQFTVVRFLLAVLPTRFVLFHWFS
ncbi:MAG TPA: hypothetical protein VN029_11325 [Sphingomonas sp.]|nr:hypothetical protein [Sphingomonas sp.]